MTLIREDYINGFVGTIALGRNRSVDWVTENSLESLLVVGICTDICVIYLLPTLVSARNHEMMPGLVDSFMYEAACATYDLPREGTGNLSLALSLVHPKCLAQHIGVIFVVSRGARLANGIRQPA